MVKPFALLIVELGTALAHTAQRETLNKLLHGEHLIVTLRVPAQQSQEVNHRLREVASLTVTR